jgi:5-(carboxyamino)imidazole ribonucleotide synthase
MSINPGAMLGILGGGQLGRMFTMAAQSMGYRVTVLDPADDSPTSSIADCHLAADYLDPSALRELGSTCAAVTTEFENVPAEALRILATYCTVSPAADSVAIAQNRIREKQFLSSNGFQVAPFRVIDREWGPNSAPNELREAQRGGFENLYGDLFPGILKVSRFGYDGKGQALVNNVEELKNAFDGMNREPCVVEKLMPLKTEISVIVARGFNGEVATFTVPENRHRNGILDVSIAPARLPSSVVGTVREAAVQIAERLDYNGVLCAEFFVLEDGRLLVNEIAPRPHNSGHYTIDACVTSQFEQQVRVLCGMPLGSTAMHSPAVMVNLLGDLWSRGEPEWEQVLRYPEVKLHLYGKHSARPGRKMGHYTVLDDNVEAALQLALEIKQSLEIKQCVGDRMVEKQGSE